MSYDYLPALPASEMNSATRLNFQPYTPSSPLLGWDNSAFYGTSRQYAILYDTFVVTLKQGATYDFFSSSYFDPFILELHDSSGAVIAIDQNQGSYGMDMIFGFVPSYTGDYYISASWDQGLAASHRYVSVSVYEDVDTIPPIVPQYGGSGIDFASMSGTSSAYGFALNGHNVTLTQSGRNDQIYVDVERFHFDDVSIAIDIDGNAGKAYRLYEAAFDRVPDRSGLGFWIAQLDAGAPYEDVADIFVTSDEFKGLYGANISNEAFVNALYTNVLGRAPDADGAAFWIAGLDNGATRAQVLTGFAQSPENQQGVIGDIQNGIQYDLWVG